MDGLGFRGGFRLANNWGVVKTIDTVGFLVFDDFAVAHGDDAFLEIIDDLFVVGCYENSGAEIVDFFEEINNFGGG